MNLKVYLLLAGVFVFSDYCRGQGFDSLLQTLSTVPASQRSKAILDYIQGQGGVPLLENDTVIFLVHSPVHAPKIMSGFNGFLNPRYVTDSTAGNMQNIPQTSWYFLKKKFARDARIFYQYRIGEQTINDPLNHLLGYRFNMVNSELRMPEFKVHEELIQNQSIPMGELKTLTFDSEIFGQERTLQVYLPPNYLNHENRYPSAYFHDGSFYVEWGNVPQVLDYLIAQKHIAPIVAIFDNPFNRGKEYRGDSLYTEYMVKELIPFIDGQFRTQAFSRNRAVIGGSRGALSSIILSHATPLFENCGLFSPAVHPWDIDEFVDFLAKSEHKPSRVVMIGAIYDQIWFPDALALKKYFEDQKIDINYLEIHQGHNIQSWINYLDHIMMDFFPIAEDP